MRDHTNEESRTGSTDRQPWRPAEQARLSRRQLLQLGAIGLGAASGLIPWTHRMGLAEHTGSWVKPTPDELFIKHRSNLEMRWDAMGDQGYLVPNHLFYIRNHTVTPHIDADSWRLRVEGSGVIRPVELTYDDILAMPSTTETKFIECAGNGRSFFNTQQGRQASGTQWRLGAVGVAEWTGVPLAYVLERAGLKETAVDVMPEGLDRPVGTHGHVRRPIPVEAALASDTLLVYAMNGEPLPPDHGFPLRLLVPGWVGIANIKWVGRIEVAEERLFSFWNTDEYIFVGDDYPERPVVTTQMAKSAFELPFPAQLPARRQLLHGRSWSGQGKIERVEVSVDGGATWRRAQLDNRNVSKAWVRWAIEWTPAPGEYTLKARATDSRGNVQPVTVPHNDKGYAFWAVVNHPVTVS